MGNLVNMIIIYLVKVMMVFGDDVGGMMLKLCFIVVTQCAFMTHSSTWLPGVTGTPPLRDVPGRWVFRVCVHMSLCLWVCGCVYLCLYLCICLSVCLPESVQCTSIYRDAPTERRSWEMDIQSLCLCVCMDFCVTVCICVYLCVCMYGVME